ncbi:hypothetical protein KP509_23G004600 [Ceratopteris richardii]|uniref:C3H1-type domain-containing protein n=1 Tax=Ceratopteris richardii TaxID=49495 RepID=A0A8T2RX34_CERRI|nr:hypothetical protein KP509_23G004600 [Ceratopteris richardii]
MATITTEEAQKKKDTDCVYFLASPLTCKKGNECEFRHSESARNNPRDCWYWLSGSCLNANCAFRHPPLEALPEVESAAGARSRVPCYYFNLGYCAKGDKCPFMHSLPIAPVTENIVKGLKPNASKTEPLDSQTSANKGNGLIACKGSLEFSEAPSDAPLQRPNQEVKDIAVPAENTIIEGSDSSMPARSRSHYNTSLDRPKQLAVLNGRINEVHSSDKYLHQDAQQVEEEPLCESQPGDDGLGQEASGEEHVHDGSESEEMWEESSFDVLVDDGGTDQLIYADDLDYINQYDALVELAGSADGFVDFDYDHVGAYGQYYDAEYDLTGYDAYEQQLIYEQLGSYDPEEGMQSVVDFNNRQGQGILPRDRRAVSFDGEVRPPNFGSNDLRNHIVKRRRAEKTQKYGDDGNRRRRQGNGPYHNRRHQDGHFKQQEGSARRHMSPQSGSRSHRQYFGRGEPSGGRQFHGRYVEPSGIKRPFRDMVSDHEEMCVERSSSKKFKGTNDVFRFRGRKERARPALTAVDEALGSRGYPLNKKMESRKEDSSFAGPKSLAQIKAEKLKASTEACPIGQLESGTEINGSFDAFSRNHRSQIRGKTPQQFCKEPGFKDSGRSSKPLRSTDSDFEGPKPLSVILKQKRRGEIEPECRDQRYETSDGVRVVSKSSSYSAITRDPPSNVPLHDANFSTFQDSNKSSIAESVDYDHRSFRERRSELQNMVSLTAFPTNSTGRDHADVHSSKVGRDIDSNFVTEDGMDMEDSVMEDVDFDDEEDDFAKKLGGFFS